MCFANFLFLPQTWGITGVFGIISYDGEKLKIELENMLTRRWLQIFPLFENMFNIVIDVIRRWRNSFKITLGRLFECIPEKVSLF